MDKNEIVEGLIEDINIIEEDIKKLKFRIKIYPNLDKEHFVKRTAERILWQSNDLSQKLKLLEECK